MEIVLEKFVDTFVICAICQNPETNLVRIKNKMYYDIFSLVFMISQIKRKNISLIKFCAACGHNAVVDPNHKLTKFILKTIRK